MANIYAAGWAFSNWIPCFSCILSSFPDNSVDMSVPAKFPVLFHGCGSKWQSRTDADAFCNLLQCLERLFSVCLFAGAAGFRNRIVFQAAGRGSIALGGRMCMRSRPF